MNYPFGKLRTRELRHKDPLYGEIMNKGFTLIELIVVVGILAILSTFLLTVLNPFEQFKKAQDARRKSDLAQIQKALETYYQDNTAYPTGTSGSSYEMFTSDGIKNFGDSWGQYMTIIPKDIGTRRYIYVSDGQSYYIYASLDRGAKDPQVCNNGSTCSNVPPNVVCGSATDICNYGVTSANVSP